ncbi:MAG: endolytic transglycosylase MltG [Patescibacteria group bacterium]
MLSRRTIIISAATCLLILLIVFLQTPPSAVAPAWARRGGEYPTYAHIPDGATLHETADILEAKNLIASEFFFKVFAVLTGGGTGVKAGEYYFEGAPRLFVTAWRMTHADFRVKPLRVLIPEGTSVHEMADIFATTLPAFSKEAFIRGAESREGYLFPDTYFFPPNATATRIIQTLEDTFNEKITTLTSSIASSSRTLSDIVIMASILEEEAKTFEDRQIVSGILWKRLDDDMALQVDAPFVYLLGKGSADLTLEDLKVDSPYNTYVYRGLTPTPITNPGLDSLRAAAEPVTSDYYFYLSDKSGKIYYAKTFEEHKQNKELYLR